MATTIEGALRDWLLGRQPIVELVADRIQPHTLTQEGSGPNSELPCITYEFITSNETHTIADRSGLVQSRLQYTAWAYTYAEAVNTARTAKNSGITALRGLIEGVWVEGIQIATGIETLAELISDGQQTDAGQQFRYSAEFDLDVSYQE